MKDVHEWFGALFGGLARHVLLAENMQVLQPWATLNICSQYLSLTTPTSPY